MARRSCVIKNQIQRIFISYLRKSLEYLINRQVLIDIIYFVVVFQLNRKVWPWNQIDLIDFRVKLHLLFVLLPVLKVFEYLLDEFDLNLPDQKIYWIPCGNVLKLQLDILVLLILHVRIGYLQEFSVHGCVVPFYVFLPSFLKEIFVLMKLRREIEEVTLPVHNRVLLNPSVYWLI